MRMSREIDMDNLSEDDKVYLAQRAQLPASVMPVDEQRRLLDPEQGTLSLEQRANTGTVNTANLTVEQLEELLAERRAQQDDPQSLMKLSGEAAATAETSEEEEDEGYAGLKKGQLIALIQERNEGRPEDEQLDTTGNKSELIALLEADDAEADDTEE